MSSGHRFPSALQAMSSALVRLLGIVVFIGGLIVTPMGLGGAEANVSIVAKSAAVKVTHLYLTAKYVSWPNEPMGTTAPFVIGVLGEDALSGNLDKLAKLKKVHERPIEIRRFQKAADYQACHMVYIPPEVSSDQVRELVRMTTNQPVILWRDEHKPEWPATSCSFVVENGSILIEVDPQELKRRGMIAQAQLLNLSVVRTQKIAAEQR